MATGSARPLSTTCVGELIATKKKYSDQSCRSSDVILFKRLSILPTLTSGATDQLSSQRTDILRESTRPRLKPDKLESICPFPFLFPCSRSLETRQACGASLTSMARALFSLTRNGRQSLLAGRRSLRRHSACRPTSQQ